MSDQSIPADIRAAVREKLRQIEIEHNCTVLYACESGSRAWGIASTDSDYDVRFIYVHPRNWYLRIHEQRDVIERPIVDQEDRWSRTMS